MDTHKSYVQQEAGGRAAALRAQLMCAGADGQCPLVASGRPSLPLLVSAAGGPPFLNMGRQTASWVFRHPPFLEVDPNF